MKGAFKIPGTFSDFHFAYCGSSDREIEFMAKANLGQTQLIHVSESYTLPECTNKPGY